MLQRIPAPLTRCFYFGFSLLFKYTDRFERKFNLTLSERSVLSFPWKDVFQFIWIPVFFIAFLMLGAGVLFGGEPEWLPETRVTNDSFDSETGLSASPAAFVGKGFRFTWAEQDAPGMNYRIYSAFMSLNGEVSTGLAVDYLDSFPGNFGGAKFPSIAAVIGDSLYMVWHDYRVEGINNVEIFFKTCPADGEWNSSVNADLRLTRSMHPETGGDNGYLPTLIVDRNGGLHVAWYDYRFDGNNAEIMYKYRAPGGSWDLREGDDADERVTFSEGDSHNPAMACGVDGTIYLVWSDNTGGVYRIKHTFRRPDESGWENPVTVVSDGELSSDYPSCVVTSDGVLHVVWVESVSGGKSIFYKARNTNGSWSEGVELVGPETMPDEPMLAADVGDGLHLVFSDCREGLSNREVYYRFRDNDAMWDLSGENDVRVSSGGGYSGRPSVALGEAGSVFVMWKDKRNGSSEIYCRLARKPDSVDGDKGEKEGNVYGSGTGPGKDDGTDPTMITIMPNPCNPHTVVRIQLSGRAGERVTINLFDITGNLVSGIYNGPAWDGERSFTVPGMEFALPSGVYILRVKNGNHSVTEKLVILK